MNYELAIELKYAKFPLREEPLKSPIYGDGGFLFPPTLSELIEECGDMFNSLTQGNGDSEGVWLCSSFQPYMQVYGKTKEEAVARLWIALNKK